MKHLELFSGIGGFRLAIDLVGKDLHFPTICIGYSEIDKYACELYDLNHKDKNGNNIKNFGDIKFKFFYLGLNILFL